MAFDASRPPEPERQPAPAFKEDPIDYVDWAMRMVVFGVGLFFYIAWIGHLFAPIFAELMQH